MSQSIKDIFYHALLARAAYTDLKKEDFENQEQAQKDSFLSDALQNPSGQTKMTKEMADYLSERFDFIDSSLDNNASNTPVINPSPGVGDIPLDGYDGIIFKEKNTNHYVLANRGTEFTGLKGITPEKLGSILADIFADADLILDGDNNQVGTMTEFLDKFYAEQGIDPKDINMTSAGHSLGGFLTTLAALDDRVNFGYTYNGAGVLTTEDIHAVKKLVDDLFDTPLAA